MWALVALILGLPLLWALLGAPDPSARLGAVGLADPDQPWAPLLVAEPIDPTLLLVAAAAGVLLALGRPGRITGHIGTAIHEVGHGLTAAALGGRVKRITMATDGSGMAATSLPARARVRRMAVTLAGYPAPGVVGLACARAASAGYAALWLAVMVAGLALMLLLAMRSAWATAVAIACIAAGWAVLWAAPIWAAGLTVGALSGLLLARCIADATNQHRVLAAGGHPDAAILAEQSPIPAGLFAAIHTLVALMLAGAGMWALLSGAVS